MLGGVDLSLVWGAGGPQRVRREVAAYILQHVDTKAGPNSTYSSKVGELLRRQLGPDWMAQYSQPGKQGKLKALLLDDHLKCFHIQGLGHGGFNFIIRLDVPKLKAALQQASAQTPAAQQPHWPAAQQQHWPAAQQQHWPADWEEQWQQAEMWHVEPAPKRLKLNNTVAVPAWEAPWVPALPPGIEAAAAAAAGGPAGGVQEYWTRKRRRPEVQQQHQERRPQQQAVGPHHSSGAAGDPSATSCSWYSQLVRVTPQACSNKPAVLIDLSEPPATWERPLRKCLDHLSCCHLVGLAFELTATSSPAAAAGVPAEQLDEWGAPLAQQDPGLQLYMVEVFAPAASSSAACEEGASTAAATSSSGSVMYTSSIYLIALPEEPDLRHAVVQRLLQPLLTSPHLVKVTHAPQEAAAVLQQQYGVELQGVMDTRLLAETVAATGGSGAAGGGAAAGGCPGSSTSAGEEPVDASLTSLHQQYGFNSTSMQGFHTLGGEGDYHNRQQLLEQASIKVRYLLPLAAALLQQLPAADHLSAAGAQLLSQATAQRLSQLTQQLEALKCMLPPAAGSQPQWVAGVGVPFELVLDQQHRPSYQLYLGPKKQEGSSGAAAAGGGSGGALVPAAAVGAHALATAAVDDGVASLLDLLPPCLHPAVAAQPGLLEVVIDHGRPVQLVLSDRSVIKLPGQYTVSIQQALAVLGAAAAAAGMQAGLAPALTNTAFDASTTRQLFGSSNRLSVAGSLHRVSAMTTNSGTISGLTYRVGRHMPGVGRLLLDVLAGLKSSLTAGGRTQSLLLLGRPGTGKTTLLRDISRLLSTSGAEGGLGLRVVVVDSSNEIAGDGPVPHPCIGDARRMMVPSRGDQASIMIEAVENHCPDVIIVDEIGTRQEAEAARTIAQRGVVLVGTAHGIELGGLLKNPDLVRLVGGVMPVTLGDAQAAASNQGKKVRLERAGAATFTSLVELQGKNRWRYHPSMEHSVDTLLSGHSSSGNGSAAGDAPLLSEPGWRSRAGLVTQLRSVAPGGQLLVEFESEAAAAAAGVCGWS